VLKGTVEILAMNLIYFPLFVGILASLYQWLSKGRNHFDKQKIPYQKPNLIFGNLWPLFTRKEGFVQFLERIYRFHEDAK
jgi:hypothetical protein